jgi:CoA:oxalate CoA-transferase
MADSTSPGPLDGLLVIDLSRVLAGPYCTMMLRDLGARVIKIERPGSGDDSRQFPPFFEGTRDSGYFISINRGKESVAIDFNTPEGRQLVCQLAARADLLVENFSPGLLERKGLDPEQLLAENPRLIVGRLSGYGQTGPDSALPAYDITVQARGGLMSITGSEGGEPVKIGSAISDIAAGMYMSTALLAAVVERQRSGRGQVVDLGMLDATVALLENGIVRSSIGGGSPVPIGQRHPSITPFDGYRCADGTMVIGAGNDAIFGRLARALGHPEWLDDPRFAGNDARTAHQQQLKQAIEQVTSEQPVSHWLKTLRTDAIPCSKIQSIEDVIADPQVQARGLVQSYHHEPSGRDVAIAGSAFGHLSRTPGKTAGQAPALGQHTDAVLSELLSLDPVRLAELREAGAIA